jgi:hypothetical protein
MKKNKSLKAIVLSLGLSALVLPLDAQVFNQGQHLPYKEQSKTDGSLMNRSTGGGGGFAIHPQTFFDGENYGYNLFNGTFEDVTPNITPLGSGLFIMAAAGAGYALKKRKDNKKQ